MSYEGLSLDAALAVAVGEDPALTYELRRAFLESAARQIDMLERARDDGEWQQALWRFKGLCGSFGITAMAPLIEEAEQAAAGNTDIVMRIRALLALLG